MISSIRYDGYDLIFVEKSNKVIRNVLDQIIQNYGIAYHYPSHIVTNAQDFRNRYILLEFSIEPLIEMDRLEKQPAGGPIIPGDDLADEVFNLLLGDPNQDSVRSRNDG